jgi:putative tryptophan/tyrosine transport system substrate-binding protein
MRRRDFTKLALAGTVGTVAAPGVVTVSAAEATPKLIGFLGAATPRAWSEYVLSFETALRRKGLFNGVNVNIDYQWATGEKGEYRRIVDYFAANVVDVIVTAGSEAVQEAAKTRFRKIPVIFAAAGDTENLPHNRVTGVRNGQVKFARERFGELSTRGLAFTDVYILYKRNAPNAKKERDEVARAASSLKVTDLEIKGEKAPDIKTELNKIPADDTKKVLYVCTDPFVTANSTLINSVALRKGVPTMYVFSQHVVTGGLMSYGPDFRGLFQVAAERVSQILANPQTAEYTIDDITKDDNVVVINRTTMTELGLTINTNNATVID